MNQNKLITNLKTAIETTKRNIFTNVNFELLKLYMYLGEQIQKDIEDHKGKNDYKKHTISAISTELTNEFGPGYSRRNISRFIIFYTLYKKWAPLVPTLLWGNYCLLINLKNENERKFCDSFS